MKILIECTNPTKIRNGFEADNFIRIGRHLVQKFFGRDRNGENQLARAPLAQAAQYRAGRCSRGNAVIHDNNIAATKVNALAVSEIGVSATIDFPKLARDNDLKLCLTDPRGTNNGLIANNDGVPAINDRAHRKFGLAGNADLAHEHDVEWRLKCARNFSCDD